MARLGRSQPFKPLIITFDAPASATQNISVQLTAATYAYTGINLATVAARNVTLTKASYLYTGINLTSVTARNVTLTKATFSYTGGNLSPVTARNATLTKATYAYSGINLAVSTGRAVALTKASYLYTGLNLDTVFVGSVANTVQLTKATFSYSPLTLSASATSSGQKRDGKGKGGQRHEKKLPYGWWEDKEPALVEAELKEAEKALQASRAVVNKAPAVREDAALDLEAALSKIDLDRSLDRLAKLQAKQARKYLDDIQHQITEQRQEFQAAKAKMEHEQRVQEQHRAVLARLKDDEDAITMLLS